MQDRPTAVELIQAARDFLEGEVMPELSGRKQFHVRVTVNVLRILEREWEGEETAVRDEWARLAALLGGAEDAPRTFAETREAVGAMNGELSRAIRSGDLDGRWDEVLGAVRKSVEDKLRIANPNWF